MAAIYRLELQPQGQSSGAFILSGITSDVSLAWQAYTDLKADASQFHRDWVGPKLMIYKDGKEIQESDLLEDYTSSRKTSATSK